MVVQARGLVYAVVVRRNEVTREGRRDAFRYYYSITVHGTACSFFPRYRDEARFDLSVVLMVHDWSPDVRPKTKPNVHNSDGYIIKQRAAKYVRVYVRFRIL